MPGQLEYSKDTDETYDPEDGQRHGLVPCPVTAQRRHFDLQVARLDERVEVLLLHLGHDGGERDEVRNDGDEVDDVHHVLEEVELVWAREEPDHELEREPDDAHRLYEEEGVVDVGDLVLLDPRLVPQRVVEHFVVLELGQGLQAEDNNGQKDHEHRYDGDDSGVLRALWVLEQ